MVVLHISVRLRLLSLIHPWVHPPHPHSPMGTPSSPSFTHGYTLLTLIHPWVHPPPPHSPMGTPSSPSFTHTCTPSSPSFTHGYTLLPLIHLHVLPPPPHSLLRLTPMCKTTTKDQGSCYLGNITVEERYEQHS